MRGFLEGGLGKNEECKKCFCRKSFPKKVFQGKNHFPINTVDFSNRLAKFIAERDLDVQLCNTAERVEINTKNKSVSVVTGKGVEVATQFMLTSCAVLNSFYVDGEERQIPEGECQK